MERFKTAYGEPLGILEASGYDSAMMLFELIADPEIRDRTTLKNVLLDMPLYAGVTGETVFGETGEALKKMYLLEITEGRFSEIK